VLKHEFVHVVTLQQTDFNITRWYTEGLAVRLEGPGRPKAWDAALARRVAANRLFDLATINHGFLRPVQLDDWMLAYYQSELYAQHLVDRFGRGALNKLIGAYADHLETGPALERCFGISSDAFEKGFRDYVGTLVTRPTTDTMPVPVKPMSMSALQRAVEEKPGDVDLRAQLAIEFLKVNMDFRANDHANAALAINPKHPRAALALATAHLRAREEPKALEVLRAAFDPNALDADMLSLFAALTLKTKDFNEAERLLLLGRERFPNDLVWSRLLANVYRGSGNKEKWADILKALTEGDYNDLESRAGLAQLALDRGDFREAADWAGEALHIDVMNASAHVTLARALAGSGRMDSALSEYGVAIGLEPGRMEWRLGLAEACVAAKENDRARIVLDELLARDSKYPGARELRARLGR